MEHKSYAAPAWVAIVAAALTFPVIVFRLILDLAAWRHGGLAGDLLVPYLTVRLAQVACGLYALARLKTLLNERYAFYEVDSLIVAVILGNCLVTLAGVAARIAMVDLGTLVRQTSVLLTVVFLVAATALAVGTIVFGVRLLRLEADLAGMLKPFAYTTIAANVCLMTIVLIPLGLLLQAATYVMLGMIFLRDGKPRIPDFV